MATPDVPSWRRQGLSIIPNHLRLHLPSGFFHFSAPATINAIYLRVIFYDLIIPVIHAHGRPITVAARSKVWVCGRSLAGTAVSNPVRGIHVCHL